MIVQIVGLFKKIHMKYDISVVVLFAMIAVSTMVHGTPAVSVILARDGVASMPIVVSTGATDRVKAAARDLATYLGRISGAEFTVQSGDVSKSITVGTTTDFTRLVPNNAFDIKDMKRREEYILRSHKDGVLLIGATDLAVENAVWDFLYRLGYRQFFPGETWEVIPHIEKLAVCLDVKDKPNYFMRLIWYGYGPWDYALKPWKDWCLRNRARSGFELESGHAYGRIILYNKAAFEQHPEYYGLLDGKRTSSKLCVGNPALRKLVVDYAIRQFDENPQMDSISMDPSDGGEWCECERCAALGSITDRALTLANTVADAINIKYHDKYVGMYGYNLHSPPPNIDVHSNVIISIATSFIKGGYTLDEVISGWSERGAMIGIREYYGVNTWDRDMPGQSRGSNLKYLARTIPEFYAKGARFMSAESSDNWGLNGLGYYMASRLLWNVRESAGCDEIVTDFLLRAFGPSAKPMRNFYEVINGANTFLVFDDQLGRMYRYLKEARELADTPQIQARLNDLILYSRYCELFDEYRNAQGNARQAAFEHVTRYAYRIRKTMMIHTLAFYRDLIHRDNTVSLPQEAQWDVPEDKNPWKSSDPFTDDELTAFLTNGIANHKIIKLDFKPVTYSEDLVPATPLGLPSGPVGDIGLGRESRLFYTWVDKGQTNIELKITGGLIPSYRFFGNVKIDLWKIGGASETGEIETLVAKDRSVPPDGEEYTVRLPVKAPGLYRIKIDDGGDMTRVAWATDTPMTAISTVNHPAKPYARWSACFYVPKGTRVIGMYADPGGQLLNNKGQSLFSFEDKTAADYYNIPVPDGQDGSIWRLLQCTGSKRLMTVPPCLARTAEELLLPREVVKADQTK